MSNNTTVLHWYDFLCPFCYVSQSRTAILRRYANIDQDEADLARVVSAAVSDLAAARAS